MTYEELRFANKPYNIIAISIMQHIIMIPWYYSTSYTTFAESQSHKKQAINNSAIVCQRVIAMPTKNITRTPQKYRLLNILDNSSGAPKYRGSTAIVVEKLGKIYVEVKHVKTSTEWLVGKFCCSPSFSKKWKLYGSCDQW